MLELIYIGEDFYRKSGTIMSSIYTIDGGRFDWGFVEIQLQRGATIQIRPATPTELEPFAQQLAAIIAQRESK